MNKTGLIIGDSSALPQELIQKYKIAEVIPFIVDWPEQKDVSQNNIYEKMKIAQKEGLKYISQNIPAGNRCLQKSL